MKCLTNIEFEGADSAWHILKNDPTNTIHEDGWITDDAFGEFKLTNLKGAKKAIEETIEQLRMNGIEDD